MTKEITAASLIAGSREIDRMRKEIDTITGILFGSVPVPYHVLDPTDPVVYIGMQGSWSIFTSEGPTHPIFTLPNGVTFHLCRAGRYAARIPVEHVKLVHSCLDALVAGTIIHFDGLYGEKLTFWLMPFVDAAN